MITTCRLTRKSCQGGVIWLLVIAWLRLTGLQLAACNSPNCEEGCKETSQFCFDPDLNDPPWFYAGGVKIVNDEIALHFGGDLFWDDDSIVMCSKEVSGIRPLDVVLVTYEQYDDCEAECPDDWLCPGTVGGDIFATDNGNVKEYCYDPM